MASPYVPRRVADLNPFGGPGTNVPVASGYSPPLAAGLTEAMASVASGKDQAATSKLPVSMVRAVWSRFSYQGVHSADVPTPLAGATPGPVVGGG
jgi:hypothetical protein